jgi:glutaryl-CoA dehydrogenase
VDHQWPHRRSGRGLGADARGHARLPGRTRHARLHHRGDQAQIQPARLEYRRAVFRRRAAAGGALLPGAAGIKAPLSCLSQARYGICWGVIGAAQACLAEALHHAGERVLFGRPLDHTQAVQLRLAEMVRKLSMAQLLALQLGRLKEREALSAAQISLGKWNNCRMALEIARDCRDLLGGAGISIEHVAIRHMLNLESVVTYEGTETIHQLTIARAVTGVSAF